VFLHSSLVVREHCSIVYFFLSAHSYLRCCEPTPFLQQWRTVKTLARWNWSSWVPSVLPAYTILQGLLPVSFRCRDPIRFYAGVRRSSGASAQDFQAAVSNSAPEGCACPPFIYPNLSVRLRKENVFLPFSHWKLLFLLRFFHGFFPTASRTYANSVLREVPESAQNTVFL
jgi:hypothetical protein